MKDKSSSMHVKDGSDNRVRRALLPGSFDPFTVGHAALVQRGLKLVDEIIISIGVNNAKQTYYSLEERLQMLRDLYKDNPAVRVEAYDSLTVDFAQASGADFMLRGVRSVIDFEYERMIADTNRAIAGIETIVLFAEPEVSAINSSHVRELLHYGHDVTPFIPEGMVLPAKPDKE